MHELRGDKVIIQNDLSLMYTHFLKKLVYSDLKGWVWTRSPNVQEMYI